MLNLNGLGVALITPFSTQQDVDFNALGKLVDYQLKNGADYFVVLGTTAETPTLTIAERATTAVFVAERVKKRVPVVVGISGNSTADVISRIIGARTYKFDALLTACPFYNKPTQEGLYQHFKAIAEVSSIPVIMYNVPGRTGVNLLPDTIVRLVRDCPNIQGIKDASGNLDQFRELIFKLSKLDDIDLQPSEQSEKRPFYVISGDDAIIAESMNLGARGVISVAANAFTKDFNRLVHSDYAVAKQIQNRYDKIIQLLFADGSPAGIKCVLSEQKKIKNVLRLPLVPVGALTHELIKAELNNLEN